jgi:hypothetical protein
MGDLKMNVVFPVEIVRGAAPGGFALLAVFAGKNPVIAVYK